MHLREIFVRISKCMLELFRRLLYCKLWANWLHELWDGILPVIGWVIKLLGLYRWVVLCDHKSDCSDCCLRCGELFPFHIERMYELFCRLLFS